MPLEGQSFSHHVDLKALLEHLGISKANICGLSMRSGIVVDFVLAYAEMSRSLIAEGPWVFGYNSPAAEETWEIFRKISSIINVSGTKAAVDFWIESPSYKKTIRDPKAAERVRILGYDYSFGYFLNKNPSVSVAPPAPQQIENINLPTLIITAEYDLEVSLEIADLLKEKIRNSRKIFIREAAHIMNMEKPEEFNRAVLDFLEGLER